MNIGILTSTRADYGIYKPLLHELKKDDFFKTRLIVFGTHLSPHHGMTKEAIYRDGFTVDYEVSSMLVSDDPQGISSSFGLTALKFSDFWSNSGGKFDLVFCLGDRFEMCGAVLAGVPQGIDFAHLHGGECSYGAIDEVYRHTITHAAKLHYASTEEYANRIKELTGSDENIFTVGALSLDNLEYQSVLSRTAFLEKYSIQSDIPYILSTIHPETVKFSSNREFAYEVKEAFKELATTYQLVITMPNADTMGSLYRKIFQELREALPEKVILVENFGTPDYFAAMKHASFMIGNSSSGIIEAASFNKYVINLGSRQQGRITGDNVFNIPFEKRAIIQTVELLPANLHYDGKNPYYYGGAVTKIINTLKNR